MKTTVSCCQVVAPNRPAGIVAREALGLPDALTVKESKLLAGQSLSVDEMDLTHQASKN